MDWELVASLILLCLSFVFFGTIIYASICTAIDELSNPMSLDEFKAELEKVVDLEDKKKKKRGRNNEDTVL